MMLMGYKDGSEAEMRIKVRDMNLITSQRVFVGPYIPSPVTSSSLCALTIT